MKKQNKRELYVNALIYHLKNIIEGMRKDISRIRSIQINKMFINDTDQKKLNSIVRALDINNKKINQFIDRLSEKNIDLIKPYYKNKTMIID